MSENKDVKKAAFSFEKFKINEFSFKEPSISSDGLGIKFEPSGKHYEEEGRFELSIIFKGIEGEETSQPIIDINMTAYFKFSSPIKHAEIPLYFYRNAIAIVFPYLRAFTSSLTIQANIRPVILPILNLSSLEDPLKQNTVVIA